MASFQMQRKYEEMQFLVFLCILLKKTPAVTKDREYELQKEMISESKLKEKVLYQLQNRPKNKYCILMAASEVFRIC